MDSFVSPGGLPESCSCCSVGSSPGRVLLVFVAEEVPLILRPRPNSALLCNESKEIYEESDEASLLIPFQEAHGSYHREKQREMKLMRLNL